MHAIYLKKCIKHCVLSAYGNCAYGGPHCKKKDVRVRNPSTKANGWDNWVGGVGVTNATPHAYTLCHHFRAHIYNIYYVVSFAGTGAGLLLLVRLVGLSGVSAVLSPAAAPHWPVRVTVPVLIRAVHVCGREHVLLCAVSKLCVG